MLPGEPIDIQTGTLQDDIKDDEPNVATDRGHLRPNGAILGYQLLDGEVVQEEIAEGNLQDMPDRTGYGDRDTDVRVEQVSVNEDETPDIVMESPH